MFSCLKTHGHIFRGLDVRCLDIEGNDVSPGNKGHDDVLKILKIMVSYLQVLIVQEDLEKPSTTWSASPLLVSPAAESILHLPGSN